MKKQMETMEESPWLELQPDLIRLISSRLTLRDYLAFRGVCRQWRAASHRSSARIQLVDQWPWLILYKPTSSECIVWDPSVPAKTSTFLVPELEGATCIGSLEGWLLLHTGINSLCFLNPFSRAKIDLPEFPLSKPENLVAAFSSEPTSPNCEAFVLSQKSENSFEIRRCSRGDREWTLSGEIGMHEVLVAVLDDKCLYCFGEERSLGIFNFRKGTGILYRIVPVREESKNDLLKIKDVMSEWSISKMDLLMENAVGNCLINYFGKKFSAHICGISQNDRCGINGISCLHSSYFQYDLTADAETETETDAEGGKEKSLVQGVWIEPQFFNLSSDYKWSL